MVKYCAVAVCRNGTHNRPDLAYFAFPEDNTRRRKWIAFCKRADKKFKSLVDPRICSLHFKKTDVTVSVSGRKTVTGYPTIFDPTSTKTATSARENRHEKRQTRHADQGPATKKRCVKKLNFRNDAENCEKDLVDIGKVHHDHSYFRRQEQAIPEESTVSTSSSGDPPQDKPATHSTECQTDLTADEIEYLITELEECRKKTKILEEKLENKKPLKRELIIKDMLRDDEYVKFYTGLPNLACFNFIWNLIQPYTKKIKYWDKKKEAKSHYQGDVSNRKPGRHRQLTVKEEYLIVLCRLRLGLLNRHLGDIFGVSESTISKTVTTWVCLLAKIFNGTLLRWPSREEVKHQFPKSFKRYPDTRVIIDATEFFIEKPTSPCAQKATWSDYKHHNTVKLLVGIAPNGAFTFISELWSGSTSDRKIVQESGLIDLLQEGDHVMADRGFNIRDLLTRRGVNLNIPPFSKGMLHP